MSPICFLNNYHFNLPLLFLDFPLKNTQTFCFLCLKLFFIVKNILNQYLERCFCSTNTQGCGTKRNQNNPASNRAIRTGFSAAQWRFVKSKNKYIGGFHERVGCAIGGVRIRLPFGQVWALFASDRPALAKPVAIDNTLQGRDARIAVIVTSREGN